MPPVHRSTPATTRRRRGIGRPPTGATHAVGREALITKACELLTRLPPSEVTRAAVARSMGVDPSLIRYYFRDRATLLLAAVERLTKQFVADVEDDKRKSDANAPDRLRARLTSLLRLNFTYPHFHQLIVDEVSSMNSTAARELLERLTARGLDSYRGIMQAGVKDGSLRDVNIRFLFIAIIGMTHFFVSGAPIVRIAVGEDAYNEGLMEQYGKFLCDILLHGLQADKKR
jgi:TetR/AcrR family transcriptional regulator